MEEGPIIETIKASIEVETALVSKWTRNAGERTPILLGIVHGSERDETLSDSYMAR